MYQQCDGHMEPSGGARIHGLGAAARKLDMVGQKTNGMGRLTQHEDGSSRSAGC